MTQEAQEKLERKLDEALRNAYEFFRDGEMEIAMGDRRGAIVAHKKRTLRARTRDRFFEEALGAFKEILGDDFDPTCWVASRFVQATTGRLPKPQWTLQFGTPGRNSSRRSKLFEPGSTLLKVLAQLTLPRYTKLLMITECRPTSTIQSGSSLEGCQAYG